jgi:outer membrane protein assembly factor BamB
LESFFFMHVLTALGLRDASNGAVRMTRFSLPLFALLLPLTVYGQQDGPQLIRSEMPDWPQWRGPSRDGISTETGLLKSWPSAGPARMWTVGDLGRGYSSPIVARDTIYITGDQEDKLVISALGLDGTPRWQTSNGASWKRSYPGSRSACTYDNGKLYHMNAHGRLACLDADTGNELWVVNVLERFAGKNITWGISESLLVHGDLVFATPCGGEGLVVALNKHTGDTVWATPAISGEQPSYASPILVAVDNRKLLINGAIRNVFAVDADTGELCWKIAQEDPNNAVVTIPVLSGNELVLTNASRGFGAVFGIHLDGSQAQKTWTKRLTVSHGSAVGLDGAAFGASSRGEARGWVTIDAETGSLRKLAELDGGCLIHADGHFYCLTQKGKMTLQKPTSQGFQTAGSFQFAEGKDVWAHPVICNGKLYLRFHDRMDCYDIGA